MAICSAYGCSNRTDRNRKPGVSFHKFPKEKALREQWAKAVRRLNWKPGVNAFLCSEHFSVELLNRTFASGRTELRENAVPTIFSNYHKYLQPQIKKDPQNSGISKRHRSPSPVVETDNLSEFINHKSPAKEKEILLTELLSAVSKPTDLHQPFIDYVANEIRSITNVALQNKFKRLIMNAAISISEDEQKILAQSNNAFK